MTASLPNESVAAAAGTVLRNPSGPDAARAMRIALLGNPNTGKSTLFNALTGIRQKTGNYPGVTVERHVGRLRVSGEWPSAPAIELTDLPGTYSLVARSPDEQVVTSLLSGALPGESAPDAIVLVLDAANLERNLYLASQALEFGLPVVVALTRTDIACEMGITVDGEKLARLLGCPCVLLCAPKGEGLAELVAAIGDVAVRNSRAARSSAPPPVPAVEYPGGLRKAAEELAQSCGGVLRARGEGPEALSFPQAMRAICDAGREGERALLELAGETAKPLIEAARASLELQGVTPAMAEAGARGAWARMMAAQVIALEARPGASLTDRVDRILTHRLWGMLIFITIMALVFQSIFTWAGPLMELIDGGFGSLGEAVSPQLPEGWIRNLIADGVIAGVGGVLVFVPQIVILFIFIALLEDSGYLSRAAFLMDRVLRPVGLSGRSFIPMMSGFACAIPAIMSTRTIPDRAARITTIMVAPLTSCSARLPVYTLMIAAFIPEHMLFAYQPLKIGDASWGIAIGLQGAVMLGMYVLGIVVAIPVAWLFRATLFKGRTTPFMIELPPYAWPRAGNVLRHAGGRGWSFVKSAGGIIFVTIIAVWALSYFPRPSDELTARYDAEMAATEARLPQGEERDAAMVDIENRRTAEERENSYLGIAGKAVEPAVEPLGWDWRIASAAVASFPAREVVVGALGVLFSVGGDADEESPELRESMAAARHADGRKLFTIATALSLMVFFALCMQCGATLAAIKRETNSWRWPILSFTYMTALAWAGAFAAYQIASAAGLGS